MLDPTESVHSELIIQVTERYFDFEEKVSLGGALLHPLLFGKAEMLSVQHDPEVHALLEELRIADRVLTDAHPDTNLFTFAVCRPKSAETVGSASLMSDWEEEEILRERDAAAQGGRYYAPTALQLIYDELAMAEYQLEIATRAPVPK